jgi:DNA polymerase I-like protein with 3'-5' exonuclease and polymerase domains
MEQFGKHGVEVLVPIHDAALVRIPKDGAEQLAVDIQGVWEALPHKYLPTELPFPCDVTIGERWSDL